MAKRTRQADLFDGGGDFRDASLVEEAQRRYLNYALSVITTRALPDVRDGLKPVQRRILYTMFHELRLRSDAKYRKCANIVGDVMGKFHPHGDTAIYDALARMAQTFSMRAPLVDGRGNFGSPDGDSPAAMRYTEAKLQPLADELLRELAKKTVAYRPNYDSRLFEPVVLPSRFPNLLVNGSQGIAVGMASSIPPHNLGEVIEGCITLIDKPDSTLPQVMRRLKGPDFPTGGEIITGRQDLVSVYEQGSGNIKLRGTWVLEKRKKGPPFIIIDSIPYSVERRAVVEAVAEVIVKRRLAYLVDVRDESTDDCRIVLEIKKEADPALVMAYLYKHTPLQSNVQVNLTCLVPTAKPDVAAPQRLNLLQILQYFVEFRMDVVTRRLEFDLAELKRRIHILEGFIIIFDALDETIRIIRGSDGKKDAAAKIVKRFGLDEEQVDAILELRLYRLAQLEILVLREELDAKKKEARALDKLLKSKAARWKVVREELAEIKEKYATRRMTKLVGESRDEPEYDPEAFIIEEDAVVILTEQGWLKRQREVKDLGTTRVREGDRILDVVAGSTKAAVALFSNFGTCFVSRIVEIPASTGYGTPVQSLFKLNDRERIVRMITLDPRIREVPELDPNAAQPEPPYMVAASAGGLALRFSLRGHREPSTRAGRRFMRLNKDDEAVLVQPCGDKDHIACASVKGHALICKASDISLLAGPGKGVQLIKLGGNDRLLGAAVLVNKSDSLSVENANGKRLEVSMRKYGVVSRAGKGHQMFKRGSLKAVIPSDPELVPLPGNGSGAS